MESVTIKYQAYKLHLVETVGRKYLQKSWALWKQEVFTEKIWLNLKRLWKNKGPNGNSNKSPVCNSLFFHFAVAGGKYDIVLMLNCEAVLARKSNVSWLAQMNLVMKFRFPLERTKQMNVLV